MAWQLVESVLTHHAALPDRQFRVLLVLAHAAPIKSRRSAPGLSAITQRANCSDRTAQRALTGLGKAHLITPIGGHGGRGGQPQLYELTGVEPVWLNGDTPDTAMAGETDSSGHSYGRSSPQSEAVYPPAIPGDPPDKPGRSTGHSYGRSNKTDADRQTAGARASSPPAPPPAAEVCTRCGGRHDAGDCTIRGGVSLPKTPTTAPGRRSTPTPPPWSAPRANPPPEVAQRGAAHAKRMLAERQASDAGRTPPSDRPVVGQPLGGEVPAPLLPPPDPIGDLPDDW